MAWGMQKKTMLGFGVPVSIPDDRCLHWLKVCKGQLESAEQVSQNNIGLLYVPMQMSQVQVQCKLRHGKVLGAYQDGMQTMVLYGTLRRMQVIDVSSNACMHLDLG